MHATPSDANMTKPDLVMPADYADWLASVNQRIASAQQRAITAANKELVLLYWQIGQQILVRPERQGWGAQVVDHLAKDLAVAFPAMKGFSLRNLKYMRAFAAAWPELDFVQQVAAQLPWFHNVVLLNKLDNPVERRWYARKAIEHGNVLAVQIETKLIQRQGAAPTNVADRLPAPPSELAQATLKDPYLFDFLTLAEEAQERDIEQGLITHVTKFLLALGAGFAFVGRQVRFDVGGDEFVIDLLFFHIKLRCYVVVELKATPFKPEYAGQLNFYLSAIDADVKAPDDNPTIGLLLCKEKNRTVAAYALRGMDKPMGIAEYTLVRDIPATLVPNLPTIEQIEAELQQDAAGGAEDQ